MGVGDAQTKEQVEQAGEDGVANITVGPRHSPWQNSALEPRAHHQVVALPQRRHQTRQVGKVVGIVRIAHDNVAAARLGDALHIGGAVAAGRLVHHPRPARARDFNRAVRRAVIGHDNFALQAGRRQGGRGARNARANGVLFVQARHHDRDFNHFWLGFRLGCGGHSGE